jgi:hypothetical protein
MFLSCRAKRFTQIGAGQYSVNIIDIVIARNNHCFNVGGAKSRLESILPRRVIGAKQILSGM